MGSENTSQIHAYSSLYENGFAICGLPGHNANLSLEEIKDYLKVFDTAYLNQQQRLSITYLVKLIETYIYGFESNIRTNISEKVSEHSFLKLFLNHCQI
ncbi:MAG: hypothetical protein IPJ45_17720 [Ignavibacteria bacterium]|nr:hypothetical protein [Ignavibacteria bacterium]